MKFFVGLHHPSDAQHFERSCLSVNVLRARKSLPPCRKWILDSGAFSQISQHGRFIMSASEYLGYIDHFKDAGELQAAVCQDWMCEPSIVKRTGLSVGEHQRRTTESYMMLRRMTPCYIMAVIQGFTPAEYVSHTKEVSPYLEREAWVGVGSVCRRNRQPDEVLAILLEIKHIRPDLRLHGFGMKLTALKDSRVRGVLYSADSMAWSYAARMNNRPDDANAALDFLSQIAQEPRQLTWLTYCSSESSVSL